MLSPIEYWNSMGLDLVVKRRGKRGGKVKPEIKDILNNGQSKNLFNFPRILYTNACSRNQEKLDALQILSDEFDIIAVTETWSSKNKNIALSNFISYETQRIHESGGGTVIFVRKQIPCVRYVNFRNNNSKKFEITWVIIRPCYLPKEVTVIAITCVYTPPNSEKSTQFELYESILSAFDKIKNKYVAPAFFMCGDFNRWNYAANIPKTTGMK